MGQSTISTHLSQLKQAGLVEDRRTGKSNLYRLAPCATAALWTRFLARAKAEIPEAAADQAAMRRVLRKRQDKMRSLLRLRRRPPRQRLRPRQILEGRRRSAAPPHASHGHRRPRRRRRSLRAPPRPARQKSHRRRHLRQNDRSRPRPGPPPRRRQRRFPPRRHGRDPHRRRRSRPGLLLPVPPSRPAPRARPRSEAHRILVPGGRIVILDLAKHRFEEARELYADEWLGFSEAELESMLEKAGFTDVQTSVVHKEPETPQFQTLLAVANKPA